jgi:hypothetical protein
MAEAQTPWNYQLVLLFESLQPNFRRSVFLVQDPLAEVLTLLLQSPESHPPEPRTTSPTKPDG